MDWNESFQDLANDVVTFLPKLLVFLAILIVGILVARLLARLANTVLERLGFDSAVERGGVRQALERSKYDASDIVAKLIYYTLVLFVLQSAFGVFGPNPVSDLLASVIAFLPRLFVAIVLVVIAAAIASAVKNLIVNSIGGLSYGRLLANIAAVIILGIGIIAALNQIDVATTVTTPILIAVLATLAGVTIVGVGGGLVRPMQQRWEGWLSNAELETNRLRSMRAEDRRGDSQAGARVIDVTSQTAPIGSQGPTQ